MAGIIERMKTAERRIADLYKKMQKLLVEEGSGIVTTGVKVYTGSVMQTGSSTPSVTMYDESGNLLLLVMYRSMAGNFQIIDFPAAAEKVTFMMQDDAGSFQPPHFFTLIANPVTATTCNLQITIRNNVLTDVDLLGNKAYIVVFVRP